MALDEKTNTIEITSEQLDRMSGGRNVGGIAAGQLKSLIERIERLEEEKKGLAEDIRDIYAEAKGNGFDPAIMRMVIKERKKAPADRQEQLALFDLYFDAVS